MFFIQSSCTRSWRVHAGALSQHALEAFSIELGAFVFGFYPGRVGRREPALFFIVIEVEPYGGGFAVEARSVAR
jgi:hypothetical protein